MALTAQEQELFDLAKASLPRFLFQKDVQELTAAFARIMALARGQVDEWRAYALITRAVGQWLDQHARDRGTFRQDGESDDALRARLRTYTDAVTRAAILQAAQQALENDEVFIPPGYPGLVELKRDRGFYRTITATSRKEAYFSRGYRMGRSARPLTIIVILPSGTPASTARSVYEAVRQRKAGGIHHLVEVGP